MSKKNEAAPENPKVKQFVELVSELSRKDYDALPDDVKKKFKPSAFPREKDPGYNFLEEQEIIGQIFNDYEITDTLQARQSRKWKDMSFKEQEYHRTEIKALMEREKGKEEERFNQAVSRYLAGMGLGYTMRTFKQNLVLPSSELRAKRPYNRKPKA